MGQWSFESSMFTAIVPVTVLLGTSGRKNRHDTYVFMLVLHHRTMIFKLVHRNNRNAVVVVKNNNRAAIIRLRVMMKDLAD